MERNTEQKNPPVLPEGKFAEACCGECRHVYDVDGSVFGTDKVQCELDMKWHRWHDCCSKFEPD